MINFKKINIHNLKFKLGFPLNLNLINIYRYNHTHFTDYDKMIRNMKALRDKMDGCLKEKYIFKYQHNLNLEGYNNKFIIDKYTLSILHKNHNKYINYNNPSNQNFSNKLNQIIFYDDFDKMLEIMKIKKIEFHQSTNNYPINTKYSFINLTYCHKSKNKNKEIDIFISGRIIDKMKSTDDYNIIITNEMKLLENI